MKNLKITIGNYSYGIRKTTKGEFYIVRSFSSKGFAKWEKGLLQNRAGIIK